MGDNEDMSGAAHGGRQAFPNKIQTGNAEVFVHSIRYLVGRSYNARLYEKDVELEVAELPLTATNYLNYVSRTAVHELGHLLGLVNPTFLGGSNTAHNRVLVHGCTMNPGGTNGAKWKLSPLDQPMWLKRNADYLRFVLPKP
jgi:hypothetical protein